MDVTVTNEGDMEVLEEGFLWLMDVWDVGICSGGG